MKLFYKNTHLILLIIVIYYQTLMSQPFSKKYIMAFHTCDTECSNPQKHTTRLVESDEGFIWTLVPNVPVINGSVPDVIIRGNKLYLYNPGKVKIYDNSLKVWSESKDVIIKDAQNNIVQFVDPSAIIDSSGKIVLFFLNSTGLINQDPAGCKSYPCTKNFCSAVEVTGSDGTQFILQQGERLQITLQTGAASDPDIFFDGSQYVLYISRVQSTSAYYSKTLHGTYQPFPKLQVGFLTNGGGIPCGYFDKNSLQYWTYVHVNIQGITYIQQSIHDNYDNLIPPGAFKTVISGKFLGLDTNVSCASPSFTENSFLNSNSLSADHVFYPDPGIRVMDAGIPNASYDSLTNTYYLFYSSEGSLKGNAYATSKDGLNFTVVGLQQNYAYDPRRTLLPDGKWRLYLWNQVQKILESKTSSDGAVFTSETGSRYSLHSSDNGMMGIYDIFVGKDKKVILLYLGDLMGMNNLRKAISTDNGYTFSFDKANVLDDVKYGGAVKSFVDTRSTLLLDGRRRLFSMREGKYIYSHTTLDSGMSFTLDPGILTIYDFKEFGALSIHDPSVIALPDGRLRIYVCIRIKQNNNDAWAIVSATTRKSTTSVKQKAEYGDNILSHNYPNPFNSSTNIEFQIKEYGHVILKVFDILGREVRTLLQENLNPGNHSYSLNGNDLPSGIYFYRLYINTKIFCKSMILLK